MIDIVRGVFKVIGHVLFHNRRFKANLHHLSMHMRAGRVSYGCNVTLWRAPGPRAVRNDDGRLGGLVVNVVESDRLLLSGSWTAGGFHKEFVDWGGTQDEHHCNDRLFSTVSWMALGSRRRVFLIRDRTLCREILDSERCDKLFRRRSGFVEFVVVLR